MADPNKDTIGGERVVGKTPKLTSKTADANRVVTTDNEVLGVVAVVGIGARNHVHLVCGTQHDKLARPKPLASKDAEPVNSRRSDVEESQLEPAFGFELEEVQ